MSNQVAKQPVEKATPAHKVMTVIGVILCIILIPILIINCTLIIRSYLHSDSVPMIGGNAPLVVLTDSMYPTIQSGDLIVVHSASAESIQVGDVIAFFDPASNDSAVVTHAVVEVITGEDGSLSWRTKGDANTSEDANLVPADNLVGVYTGRRLAGVGNFILFLSTTWGLVLFVGVPLLLLIGYDILRRRLYDKRTAQDTSALMAELEALKAEKAAAESSAAPESPGAE